jgi:hypothetical protein
MSATARLVVQMTPKEKAALTQSAKKAGLSAAEFVRRRVQDDGVAAGDDKDEIEALLLAIEAAAPAILKSLEATIEMTDAMTAALSGHGRKTAL